MSSSFIGVLVLPDPSLSDGSRLLRYFSNAVVGADTNELLSVLIGLAVCGSFLSVVILPRRARVE